MPDVDPYRTLAQLLGSAGMQPLVSPERVVSSSIYDISYRICVISCAFDLHGKADPPHSKRILSARLKLFQFVAIRPWLLPVLREWAAERTDPQLSLIVSQRLRRGFLGDAMHDRVVEYLSAKQWLAQAGAHVNAGPKVSNLSQLSATLQNQNLFQDERRVLTAMLHIKITNSMLEGW